jgi:hypothetical protein
VGSSCSVVGNGADQGLELGYGLASLFFWTEEAALEVNFADAQGSRFSGSATAFVALYRKVAIAGVRKKGAAKLAGSKSACFSDRSAGSSGNSAGGKGSLSSACSSLEGQSAGGGGMPVEFSDEVVGYLNQWSDAYERLKPSIDKENMWFELAALFGSAEIGSPAARWYANLVR